MQCQIIRVKNTSNALVCFALCGIHSICIGISWVKICLYALYEGILGSGGVAPLNLNLGNIWKLAFVFTPLWRNDRYPSNRKLPGPPRAGWALWVYMKKSLPLPGIEPRFLGQVISLDPVSEVRLVRRAFLTALCLLASNRFITTSNPAVDLAQVYARSVKSCHPKPLTPMLVQHNNPTIIPECGRFIGTRRYAPRSCSDIAQQRPLCLRANMSRALV
jgi:hypothetical protein